MIIDNWILQVVYGIGLIYYTRFSLFNAQLKKGFGVNQNPFILFLFPSTVLPVSGSMSIFSGHPFEPPQKREQ